MEIGLAFAGHCGEDGCGEFPGKPGFASMRDLSMHAPGECQSTEYCDELMICCSPAGRCRRLAGPSTSHRERTACPSGRVGPRH
jgi:hypothetical protein